MVKFGLSRWTRAGILQFAWSPYESFEKLVLSPVLKEKLLKRVDVFLQGEEKFHSMQLPWRYGVFFFGPSGCGKTAAGRAIAKALNWQHLTIPAHEILDAHLFERALSDALSKRHRVIVLEDVDLMVRVMEPEVFFTLLDHAMERAEATFWVANTRRAEDAPKIQLLRPGRFDEAIRLEPPGRDLRQELFLQLLQTQAESPGFAELVEETQGLTFSHFEELRQIGARLKLENTEDAELMRQMKSYIEDQLIAGDRWGGVSDSTVEMNERVKQIDPRVLTAALDMTDVFRKLIEKVIGDAAEQAKKDRGAGQGSSES